ncbi:hypothetical protein EG329_011480 [Mollisiaceae sp. DMI_Dod_QoI]|nr:hypothetical protein EG329_011480 [Helotiales sp. DMI_Dod_QoI]
MSHSEADTQAYALLSRAQPGNNGRNSEVYQTPQAASYQDEAQDSRTYSKPTRNLDENRKRMYFLNQSSNSLMLPTEYHDGEEQLRRLLWQGSKRLMYTGLLVACLFSTIFGFRKYDVMTIVKVRVYNTLLTGLSIALGISIGSSFKDIALNLRWWFLSRNKHPQEMLLDEILECDSLRDVSWHATRMIKTSRYSIASLCIFWVLGNLFGGLVQHAKLIPNDLNDTANLPIQPFSLIQDDITNYWQSPTYFQYAFTEYSGDSDSIFGLFYSNRSIAASSILCGERNDTGDTIPGLDFASNASTTYSTSPNAQDCGPRCAAVYALENNATAPFYYQCQVSVSDVANATRPEHNVPDPHARIAAGAIALQGFQAQDSSNQFQTFPSSQSIWGTSQNGNSTGMAQLIGQGVTLSLDNRTGMIAILGTLLAVHFLLVVGGSLLANRVYVPEDSYLMVGSLLQPVLREREKRRRESLFGCETAEEPRIE